MKAISIVVGLGMLGWAAKDTYDAASLYQPDAPDAGAYLALAALRIAVEAAAGALLVYQGAK